ncbi:unnamed protein product [Phaedon cochleariae]|uniref:CUB domain-containing protein n=1 Tax=Phaedon cochleariae TaxID=80249 RepID=A0A9P0DSW9_PHACE|nr:unnamed protein product [Phaedon cochleariae]
MYYYEFYVLLTVAVIKFAQSEIMENLPRHSRVARQRDFWFGNGNRRVDHFSDRASRFLSLFTFVQFDGQDCQAADGTYGTCLSTTADCARRGGAIAGPCAGGYGTCCIFLVSCSRTIRENGTYFVNNGYPNQYDGSGSCQVTLTKSSSDVCQFRLNFEMFTIMGPESENHICNSDQFLVSGGIPVPVICGDSTGNHMNNRTQSFTLSGNSNNRVPAMVGSTGNSNFCQADFLVVPMASNVGRAATGPSATVDRICGGILAADVTLQPTTVRSTAKPFHLYFHTDGVEAPNDIDNKGFCLNYIQQPCASALT